MRIYKTLTRPVATCKAESWTLNKDITKRRTAFERKVIRRMFGGIKYMRIGESDIMRN
jgi:hypothetical protein